MAHAPEMMTRTVTFSVELEIDLAWELAQLCKRIRFDQVLEITDRTNGQGDKDQAYRMLAGTEAVRAALAEAGISPR